MRPHYFSAAGSSFWIDLDHVLVVGKLAVGDVQELAAENSRLVTTDGVRVKSWRLYGGFEITMAKDDPMKVRHDWTYALEAQATKASDKLKSEYAKLLKAWAGIDADAEKVAPGIES